MKTRRFWLLVLFAALYLGVLLWRVDRAPSPAPASEGMVERPMARSAVPQATRVSSREAASAPGYQEDTFKPALEPGPSDKVVVRVPNEQAFREMSAVIEYFKHKPLPQHGPVRTVGDGVDSSSRDSDPPADTSFARFRFEYEKHETPRLVEDLAWTQRELERLASTPDQTEESRGQAVLFGRRRKAIESILAARDRQEELHERYQRVEVVRDSAQPTKDGV